MIRAIVILLYFVVPLKPVLLLLQSNSLVNRPILCQDILRQLPQVLGKNSLLSCQKRQIFGKFVSKSNFLNFRSIQIRISQLIKHSRQHLVSSHVAELRKHWTRTCKKLFEHFFIMNQVYKIKSCCLIRIRFQWVYVYNVINFITWPILLSLFLTLCTLTCLIIMFNQKLIPPISL